MKTVHWLQRPCKNVVWKRGRKRETSSTGHRGHVCTRIISVPSMSHKWLEPLLIWERSFVLKLITTKENVILLPPNTFYFIFNYLKLHINIHLFKAKVRIRF